MLRLLLAWVAAWSLAAFLAAAWDKAAARRGARRVPETTLLGLAALGGTPGLLLAVLTLRHKRRNAAFLTLLGLVLAAQALAWAAWTRP